MRQKGDRTEWERDRLNSEIACNLVFHYFFFLLVFFCFSFSFIAARAFVLSRHCGTRIRFAERENEKKYGVFTSIFSFRRHNQFLRTFFSFAHFFFVFLRNLLLLLKVSLDLLGIAHATMAIRLGSVALFLRSFLLFSLHRIIGWCRALNVFSLLGWTNGGETKDDKSRTMQNPSNWHFCTRLDSTLATFTQFVHT